MSKENNSILKYGRSKVPALFFSLYFVAMLITCMLTYSHHTFLSFFIVIFFPMGLGCCLAVFDNTFLGVIGFIVSILSYFIYLTILILMMKYRYYKKRFLYVLVVFVILLLLNIYGCAEIIKEGFYPSQAM